MAKISTSVLSISEDALELVFIPCQNELSVLHVLLRLNSIFSLIIEYFLEKNPLMSEHKNFEEKYLPLTVLQCSCLPYYPIVTFYECQTEMIVYNFLDKFIAFTLCYKC